MGLNVKGRKQTTPSEDENNGITTGKTELCCFSSPWIFLSMVRISESRSFALLWVFSTSATALSASVELLSAYIKTHRDNAHLHTFSHLLFHANVLGWLQHSGLYLVFEGSDVVCESAHVIFQLVDSGPLGVDSRAEFVDKSLQEAKERKCKVRRIEANSDVVCCALKLKTDTGCYQRELWE